MSDQGIRYLCFCAMFSIYWIHVVLDNPRHAKVSTPCSLSSYLGGTLKANSYWDENSGKRQDFKLIVYIDVAVDVEVDVDVDVEIDVHVHVHVHFDIDVDVDIFNDVEQRVLNLLSWSQRDMIFWIFRRYCTLTSLTIGRYLTAIRSG